MNYRSIFFILGCILTIEGVFLILPMVTALIYGEEQVFAFLVSIFICLAVGCILILLKPKKLVFNVKEGFATVALGWILLSLFGCFPFFLSGDIPDFTNAFFETVSGFSTTGASILSDVEAVSRSCLFWRSFTHWIGGMGVLVFLLAVIPLVAKGQSQGGHMHLMRAESPGPVVGKLVPKVRSTAVILYIIYLVLTLLEFILLIICRMPVYEALLTAMGNAGTGGLGIKNDSMASYSPAIQWITTLFMFTFGINFSVFFLILVGKFKDIFKIGEVRCYFIMFFTAVAIITINSYDKLLSFEQNIRQVCFQVASMISTTGFSTVDFDKWPSASKGILIILMFSGACAGSTSGGIKVSRFIIMFKSAKNQLISFLHPGTVRKIKVDNKTVDDNVLRSVNVFFIVYAITLAASVFVISFDNYDFETNFTAVLASLSNIGPGLSKVGPSQNYAFLSPLSKYVLMFDMIAGRLELYPILLLFYYKMWRERIIPKRADSSNNLSASI